MKTSIRKQSALGAGVLGIGMALVAGYSVQAAPRGNARNNDVREERRDVKEARKEVKQERKELRKADTAGERREERRDVKDARQDLRREQQELRQERREERFEDRPGYGNHAGYNNRPSWNNRPTWNNQPNRNNHPVWNNRPGSNSGYGYNSNQSVDFRGTVLQNTSNSSSFQVRGDNGRIYTVTYNRASFRSGQRVKIVGYQQNGLIVATDINRI
jgi:hypothetical protein